MDLKSFSGDDFDPKQWINKAWSLSGSQNKEVFVANTVSRLQLYMKQLTNSLDEATTQIVTSIPRVLEEATALQCEGSVLEQSMSNCRSKLDKVERETGHSILALQRTHTLKASLESAASTLREADKWTALATSLEEMLESGFPTQPDKLEDLITKVEAMTNCIEVLTEAPDYDQKKLQLETLYNRLEAAASVPLLDALTDMDAGRTSRLVRLFTSMSRATPLARCWRRAVTTRHHNDVRTKHIDSLRGLSDALLGDVGKQMEWITNVLKCETPVTEVFRLYTDLLLAVDPSPSKIISAALKRASSPQDGVTLLRDAEIELRDMLRLFVTLLNTHGQNEQIPPAVCRELGRAVLAGVRNSLPKYGDWLTQMFLAVLDDEDNKLYDIVEKCTWHQQVIDRSNLLLTNVGNDIIGGAAGALQYIRAIETFATNFTKSISSHSRIIENRYLASINSEKGANEDRFNRDGVNRDGVNRDGVNIDSGVLSPLFPASLKLASAAGEAAGLLAQVAEKVNKIIEFDEPQNPLDSPSLLLTDAAVKALTAYRQTGVFVSNIAALRREQTHLGKLTDSVLFTPARIKLETIPSLGVWNNNDALSTDLPDFAISPQEYITEVGQYLMTLPQHLEMHLSDKQAPLEYLNRVCNSTCDLMAEKVLTIRNMDELGTKRCLTDIAYLSSVVEDLDSSVTPALANLDKSLRLAAPAGQ